MGKGKKKSVEPLLSSLMKFSPSSKLSEEDFKGLPECRCTLYSDKKLHVLNPKTKKKNTFNLSDIKRMKRIGEGFFHIERKRRRPRTLCFIICDSANSFLDWHLEITDLLGDIEFEDLDPPPDEPIRRTSAKKYVSTSVNKFNDIPIMLIKSTNGKSSYLITKTLKPYDYRHGFNKIGEKIHGAQGKFRAAWQLGTTRDGLVGVKELRLKVKPGASTAKIEFKEMMDEMKKMKKCKCRLKIYDVFQIGQKAYCIMDYMDGSLKDFVEWKKDKKIFTLDVLHAEDKPIIEKRGRQIGRFILNELIRDLREIHKAGYAHKDIKPDNILVKKGRVALADYGNVEKGEGTWLRGSPNYMPVENYRKERSDKSTDVYNLGLTWLYYFIGDHLLDVILRYCNTIDDVSYSFLKKVLKNGIWIGWKGASEMFSYFYNNCYDKRGELNEKFWNSLAEESRTVSDPNKQFYKPWKDQVDSKLMRARKIDPELYAFVWERILNQSGKERAKITEVDRKISALYRKSPGAFNFNRLIDHPNNLMKRVQLEKAFKEASKEYGKTGFGTKRRKGKTKLNW